VHVTVAPASVTLTQSQTQAFSATVTNTGNTAVTWSLSPLVGGISTASLYTAPASIAASQTVTVTATSVADPTKSAAATVTLNPAVSVTVAPPSVTLTQSQAQTFSAIVTNTSNTAVTWSINPAVGSINWAGLYTAPASISTSQTVTVTGTSVADPTKSASATVTLAPPATTVSVTPTAATMLPSQGQTFTATVTGATSTGVTWSIAPETGTISSAGLYTSPSTIASTSSVTVKATSTADQTKSGTALVTLIPPLQITTASLPGGIAGTAYNASLAATGGVAPYTWSGGSGLPAGLSLSAAGAISGTPTTAGSYNVTVKVTDAAAYQATAVVALVIAAAGCQSCGGLGITTASVPAGIVGSAYSATLAASGGASPYTWSISAGQLPPGLSLASATGVISGAPSSAASYSFTAMVTDSASPHNTASQTYTLTITGTSTDQYGGDSVIHCPAGATGAFHTSLIGSQWYLCDPLGNAMWGQGAYAAGPQGDYTSKYGSQTAAEVATVTRLKSWGFNLLPPYSDVNLWPSASGMSANKIPYLPIFRPGLYGMDKNPVAGPLTDGIKDLVNSASPYWSGGSNGNPGISNYGGGEPDWGDTTRQTAALHYMLAVDTGDFANILNGKQSLDYIVGIAVEDSDQTWGFWGGGNGDPFPTQPPGMGTAHGGFITAILSPQQQAEAQHWHLLYNDHTVYTKLNWQAYLQAKYGTIGALNAAWSTGGAYTTFGSTATTVSGETFATTDGVNASFSHTLAKAGTISPDSIQVYQDGKMIAGDCFQPNSGNGCNPVNGNTWGTVYGPTASGGSVNYSTKAVTLNYSGPFVYFSTVSCVSGGSCTGTVQWYDADTVNLSIGNSIMVRFSNCCNSAKETVTNVTGTWGGLYTYTYTNTANNNGSGSYSAGGQLAQITVPSAGHVLTVTYQVNGWDAGGTGLMDEDGRPSHTWLGTDPYALSNANATFASDSRAWLGQLATVYFGAIRGQIAADFTAAGAAVPMYVGPDGFGTWTTPPRKEVLQAAAPYLGMAIMGYGSGYNLTQAELDYMTAWFAKPYFSASFLHSQADSPFSTNPLGSDYATQALRGAAFVSSVQNSLAARSGGVNPYLGNLWWQYGDNSAEQANWGLVTLKDNAYDGHEAVTGSVACSPPTSAYTCGGESGNYGNVISSVIVANGLWRLIGH
jgi:hypothetical protein